MASAAASDIQSEKKASTVACGESAAQSEREGVVICVSRRLNKEVGGKTESRCVVWCGQVLSRQI